MGTGELGMLQAESHGDIMILYSREPFGLWGQHGFNNFIVLLKPILGDSHLWPESWVILLLYMPISALLYLGCSEQP